MPESTWMDKKRHQRLRTLFEEAVRGAPSLRQGYLERECADDPALHAQVLRLLAAHDHVGSILDRPGPLLAGQARQDVEFIGTERFTVLRRLGAGGMGIVYEVEDRDRGEIVALKTLRHLSGQGIYRLKQEFRRLADVSHPNVVCKYELVVEDGRGFFTMELVRGVDFIEYVRGPRRTLSIDRLIPALRQLLEGVAALHGFGKLHRDIKPSNVLITSEGRLVILDFGLIAEILADGRGQADHVHGGTPAYLAPEAAAGEPPSEAGDWYGVGATLYEALTGEAPFKGTLFDLLVGGTRFDPPAPDSIANVPPELSAICVGLMCRDPKRRMSGLEALRRLGGSAAPFRDQPVVGRRPQLDLLDDALRTVVDGHAASVCVHGPSGIGKSALLRAFRGQVSARSDIVWLTGRCYEHESVPYKGLDGVIDSLSRYLKGLTDSDVEHLVPADITPLSWLFPVMRQVNAIEAARNRQALPPEGQEPLAMRRQAFAALRALMTRLAIDRTVVVSIDDFHWADADSATLLDELLRPPAAPRILTILCFRTEEIASKPFLEALLDTSRPGWSILPLAPLTESEASELIGSVAASGAPVSDAQKIRIAREAGGNAFLLEQLARYAAENDRGPEWAPTFDEMFHARLAALPGDTRGFLEALAICGRPVAPSLLGEAAGVEHDTRSLVSMLRNAHLIRSSGSADRIEPYHDRIREALAAEMSAETVRRMHSRMARVLIARQSDEPEALFEHLHGAGDQEGASVQAARVAQNAGAVLAFDRAAVYYRHAIVLAPGSPNVLDWKEGLATSLGNAGRPAEAAEAFLDAASGASTFQRIELSRRGAEQFLIGGHIRRGLDVIRTVLPAVNLSLPATPRRAVLSRVRQMAMLRWRGLKYQRRTAKEITPETLLRVDTCWSVMRGLALVDMIAAADFSARHLRLALEAGEPSRIVRAMVTEGAWIRATGSKNRGGMAEEVRRARAIAESLGHPHLIALCHLSDGLIAITAAQWKEAAARCEQSLGILRDRCVDVGWELNIAQQFLLGARLYLGEIADVSRQLPDVLATARSVGNLFLETELCTRMNLVWLAPDRPDEGDRLISECMARWSTRAFYRQHYNALLARVQTALYRGDGDTAWRLIGDAWPAYQRAQLPRIQTLRVEASYLRARSALAAATERRDRRALLPIALRAARRLAAERIPWSDGFSHLVRAGLACLEGNGPCAEQRLTDAIGCFDLADMKLYAAAARRRLAALRGARDNAADAWMASQGIANPQAMTRMLAPGFPD